MTSAASAPSTTPAGASSKPPPNVSAWVRVLKVARTIADLAGDEAIRPAHVAEAIQYRAFELLRA